MYWIGYDIGSSSVKAALISSDTGSCKGVAHYPKNELDIHSVKYGWAEQSPETWWDSLCHATRELLSITGIKSSLIKGIGISYQMHGLVVVDDKFDVLRPSIIWCDSRAVQTGNDLFEKVGEEQCISRLLNNPGNFTLSKLKWVKDNEPEVYRKIHKYMLPGDYIGLRLTGECITTPSGLSEGIAWDFIEDAPANWLLNEAKLNPSLIPEVRPTFSEQGRVTKEAASITGLPEGIPIMYRAGDQPNNALSLNVLEPGEIAATGGTSGVIYAISDVPKTKEGTRINCFAHVNHSSKQKRIGKLLCINGTGSLYTWLRKNVGASASYDQMNKMAMEVPIGAKGLTVLPFGNGTERMLENINRGARIANLDFNRHHVGHIYRAALEGIAFSFVKGIRILEQDGVAITSIKAGNDNLFRATIFGETIASLTNTEIKIIETTGAVGAARAAAKAFGDFDSIEAASITDKVVKTYKPSKDLGAYNTAYSIWQNELNNYKQ